MDSKKFEADDYTTSFDITYDEESALIIDVESDNQIEVSKEFLQELLYLMNSCHPIH